MKLQPPYIVYFNTKEEWKEFLPFLRENNKSGSTYSGTEYNSYKNFAIHVNEDYYFCYAYKEWYAKEPEFMNIIQMSFQEWKQLEYADEVINDFQIY